MKAIKYKLLDNFNFARIEESFRASIPKDLPREFDADLYSEVLRGRMQYLLSMPLPADDQGKYGYFCAAKAMLQGILEMDEECKSEEQKLEKEFMLRLSKSTSTK